MRVPDQRSVDPRSGEAVVHALREFLKTMPEVRYAVIFSGWSERYAADPSAAASGAILVACAGPETDGCLAEPSCEVSALLGMDIRLRYMVQGYVPHLLSRPHVVLKGDPAEIEPLPGWPFGRETIAEMLADGRLEKVEVSTGDYHLLLIEAAYTLDQAEGGVEASPLNAYVMAYDAVQQGAYAALALQGLRPTARGGTLAAVEAVLSQIEPYAEHAAYSGFRHLFRYSREHLPENIDLRDKAIQRKQIREVLEDARSVISTLSSGGAYVEEFEW